MAQVNTKLKIDPFLRSNTSVSKPENVGSILGIVKRKSIKNDDVASGDCESGNAGNSMLDSINEEVIKIASDSQKGTVEDGNCILSRSFIRNAIID
jgi:hypothetical protein